MVVEELILQAADMQKSAREVEGNVLQDRGTGPLLATAQKVTGSISIAITVLEDVLMASMEGNVATL